MSVIFVNIDVYGRATLTPTLANCEIQKTIQLWKALQINKKRKK